MRSELARERPVEETARIVSPHLEANAHLELSQSLVDSAVHVVQRVAPGNGVNTEIGPFPKDRCELLGRTRRWFRL
jgi:hypothetical protein